MLKRSKKIAFNELDRIENLVRAEGLSRFEEAWFEASGENSLTFDFGSMKESVMNARFGIRDMDIMEDIAWTDGTQTVINKTLLWTQADLVKTL